MSVFGDDYNTPDGSPIRDYIDVVDLAKAHVVAIRRLLDGKNKANYEYFNIGTGNGLSVLGLIKAFEKATGEKVNYKIVGRRAGRCRDQYGQILPWLIRNWDGKPKFLSKKLWPMPGNGNKR